MSRKVDLRDTINFTESLLFFYLFLFFFFFSLAFCCCFLLGVVLFCVFLPFLIYFFTKMLYEQKGRSA